MKGSKMLLTLFLISVLVFSVFSAGCISEKATTTTSNLSTQSVQEQKSETGNNAITITDSAGRKVTLVRPP